MRFEIKKENSFKQNNFFYFSGLFPDLEQFKVMAEWG